LPPRKVILVFLAKLVTLMALFMLPWPVLGGVWSGAFGAIGNFLVADQVFVSGAHLSFRDRASESEPADAKTFDWEATLLVQPARGRRIEVPIDVRALAYLPVAAFVALVLAFPVRGMRRRLFILGAGIAWLAPLTVLLISLPLFPFLGGAGPVEVFRLSPTLQSVIEMAYRALVAPPGMTYAIPALLFWALLALSDPATTLGSRLDDLLRRIGSPLRARTS
jgi:hypothetical protein